MTPPSQSARPGSGLSRPRGFDLGLLILRGAAALVLVTWGGGKFHSLVQALNSNQPLGAWRFGAAVRQVGFPVPIFMAVCAVLNESVIAALLVLGVVSRPAALFALLGWIGCFYSNIHWHQELLRPTQLALIFAALAFPGAGRYSIDHVFWSRKSRSPEKLNDFGLLLLRIGTALASIALVIFSPMKQPHLLAFATLPNWLLVVACAGAVLVGFGFYARLISAVLLAFWICTMSAGLLAGQSWNAYPFGAALVGSALFAIIYGALAFTGPGRIIIPFPCQYPTSDK